jgi:branched-chain amino acid transport system substrate-binding protein
VDSSAGTHARRQNSGAHTTLIAGLLAAVLLIVACGGGASSSGPTGSPINIGALIPLTGDGAPYGPGIRTGAQIAVDQINAAGGVLGRPLKLFVEDDATNADVGVRGAHKLLDVNKCVALVGLWASAVTLAVAPLTIAKPAMLLTVSGSPLISELKSNHTVFRFYPPDPITGQYLGKEMYADGYRKVAILSSNYPGVIGVGQGFAPAFQQAGGTIVQTVIYAPGQSDYSSQVRTVLSAHPDLILNPSFTDDNTIILKELYQSGSKVPLIAPGYSLNDQVIQALGPQAVEGDMIFDNVAATKSDAYKNLNAAYKKATGKEVSENIYAVKVYDEVQLLAMSIQKAGGTKAPTIGQAMLALSNQPGKQVPGFQQALPSIKSGEKVWFYGAGGPLNFNDTDDAGPLIGLSKIQNGKQVLTKTFP